MQGRIGIAALSAARSKNTDFSAKYKRIASRRGPMRAVVAVEHAMIIAAFNMLTNGAFYRDPGADYYTARHPARTKARAIDQLETLGYRHPGATHPIRIDHHPAGSPVVVTELSCQVHPGVRTYRRRCLLLQLKRPLLLHAQCGQSW